VSRRIRVLLADDHNLVRAGLRKVLEQNGDLVIVGEVSDGPAALAFLERQPVDVVVLDLTMPGEFDGFGLLRRARARWPRLPLLVLTMHASAEHAARAVRDGASGYLLKDSAADELVAGVRAVMAGRAYYGEPVQRALSELVRTGAAPRPVESLTDREMDVLRLVARGLSTKEIAARFDISARTVETHRAHIMQKLELRSVALLTQFALREGLIERE
jgi:DNA-binding NarL/FixJ family response regulator